MAQTNLSSFDDGSNGNDNVFDVTPPTDLPAIPHVFVGLPHDDPTPSDPNILPIRINFLRTRDFKNAASTSASAAATAFNEGCQFSRKLEKLATDVEKSFAPKPDECRAASYFDAIISSHHAGMRKHAQLIMEATAAFVEQCNALEALAIVMEQSDHGTELTSVKKMRVIKQDGTGIIINIGG